VEIVYIIVKVSNVVSVEPQGIRENDINHVFKRIRKSEQILHVENNIICFLKEFLIELHVEVLNKMFLKKYNYESCLLRILSNQTKLFSFIFSQRN